MIAGAVQIDATLSSVLLPEGADGRAELAAQVLKAVGPTNSFATLKEIYFRDRDRVRNAWIGEGLGHAMLIARSRQETHCLRGRVAALSTLHTEPSESGLDAVAIYTVAEEPFVAIGETKSTRARAVDELRKAAGLFAGVDDAQYGPHLRSHLVALRRAVPDAVGDRVTGALLRDAACYLPVIVHGEAFGHLEDRAWLASLRPPRDRRRLLVLRLEDFHGFFDRVADTMRVESHLVVL
ncbi:MAG: hypothetical protein ACR2NB_05785 [Solirubrobacteraceae bacterium]